MNVSRVIDIINVEWESSGSFKESEVLRAINIAYDMLDSGKISVAEKVIEHDEATHTKWKVNEWLKKAILLSFKFLDIKHFSDGVMFWRDKITLKDSLSPTFHKNRIVPGAWVRRGVYLAETSVVMPSFVNVGVRVGEGSMIDSGSSIGSCAYIGSRCHVSSGAMIGGVLEPLQATPVIIDDGCFIGAGCCILEGVVIGKESVLASGVTLSASTKIVHRETGDITYGYVPPHSVVIPGAIADENSKISILCAVITKSVSEQTRKKVATTSILRD
ncbi:2,3,4,5-tetrahydropyridine-2,6-dicarboxylate N-succinyltransferase [Candidatus Hydrogenosomobacter endosymbioticus]|uniref:2,3,4,5-tetrahydropyridine-2,6-dicarboxylate N-succinyltransferase n=1 Tax=Candidatus Hydrogenosomobacter endosymbioticus TaxID=2558174 RepID=A0ABM7V9E6_9PROT|nr:2,3,4,5-tetrahydropyridine-2,6-dicarboxylate N-succinyltransferase [Candidatus Hydrogenosomobacter endosymbioticus]BDB96435.1 2,3,4,5-tetrahydropyridine-2,6-dicarboxylate N-succinyltransferase [Candidatus Hydrogenosomobacter endosymbioticus]